MFRSPRPRDDVKKCRFCRRDKKKCLPETRTWPGEKCEWCLHHGYDCSEGQSAEQEKRHVGVQQRRPGSRYRSRTQATPRGALILREPSRPNKAIRNQSVPLDELFVQLWGNPNSYYKVGSGTAKTFAEAMIMGRQLAEHNSVLFHSLQAFCAATTAVYAKTSVAHYMKDVCRYHLAAALFGLTQIFDARTSLGDHYLLPVQAALVLLSCLAVSIDDPKLMEQACLCLGFTHKYCTTYPVATEFYSTGPGQWRLRIFLLMEPQAMPLYFWSRCGTLKEPMTMAISRIFGVDDKGSERPRFL